MSRASLFAIKHVMIPILNDIREQEYVSLFSIRIHHRRLTMEKRRIKLSDGGDDDAVVRR